VSPAASADAPALLVKLRGAAATASAAQRHHRLLRDSAYARLGAIAGAFNHALHVQGIVANAACATGARAASAAGHAGRQARRAHSAHARGRLSAALRGALARATRQLHACRVTITPKAPVGPPSPPAAPQPLAAASIAGRVLSSSGQPLPGLVLTLIATTSPRGELYGHSDFSVTTDANGHFSLPQRPESVGALSWRAEAAFPWYGGVWPRNLTTVDQSDPQQLTFRADLTATTHPFGSPTTDGAVLRLGDWDGCQSLGPDPAYPASDPTTSSLTITLRPDGSLLDGTTGTAFTASVPADTLCLFNHNAVVDIPAGAWVVSAITNRGAPIAFSVDPDSQRGTSARVFATPQDTSSPTEMLYVHYAN
jgi:hypothetical protein